VFTGIIREVGTLRRVDRAGGGARLVVEAPRSRPSLVPGGSIAVDGVCLTVTALEGDAFAADVVPETLDRTRLGDLRPGARVNLELPLKVGDPLDGHLVQGHVDGVGRVVRQDARGTQVEVTVRVPAPLAPYLAGKGSVAVNGVSLTVTTVTADTFSVALIPTTRDETNLTEMTAGSAVNVEVDVLARYVARLASLGAGGDAPGAAPGAPAAGLTRERLEEMGY
jgi:riboflavin synthase